MRLVHAGFLRAEVKEPFHERLLYLHKALDQLLQDHEVDEVSVETPFYGVNVKSLMQKVTEQGKYAAWISPPPKGVNGQPIDFEYVRL